jgi:conjugative relaxase-like TrwC/TraI family protein
VLKIHVVRHGGYRYYVDDLVPGRAEGTLVAGEAPGAWTGAGASLLGMTGVVEPQGFGEVLDGRDPWSGAALRKPAGERSVAGYDLTFCAPKSVSLLHLLAPREMAGAVGAGHHAAVTEATEYLQRVAVGVRRTRAGRTAYLSSVGVVAGRFPHRTSRALDPHLHTHLVVANATAALDGGWSSLDGRRLFAHVRAAGAIYNARLRMELSDRIGAAWDVAPSGLGDVIGVDTSMRRLFSQRTAAIEEYVVRRVGRRSPGRTRGAFHATRPAKDPVPTVESLVGEWKLRATDYGFDLGDLTRVVGRRRELGSGAVIDGRRVRQQLGQMASRNRTVARRDLVAVIARASTAGTSAEVIEAVAARLVDAAGSPLSGDPVGRLVSAPDRASGRPDPESRWTATDMARVVDQGTEALLAPTAWKEGLSAVRVSDVGHHRPLERWDRDRPLVVEGSTPVLDVPLELER